MTSPQQLGKSQPSPYPRFHEEFDASDRALTPTDGLGPAQRVETVTTSSGANTAATPSRGGTLKKRNSLGKKPGLKRSSSRRSSRAGSVRSLSLGDREKYEGNEMNSAFVTPVPTTGNPTEILAHRFSEWRRVLKDLITYYREIQTSYENRSKSLLKVSNVISNTTAPPIFLKEGGIYDATDILGNYHRKAISEAGRAKDVENEVILQLTGLRSDLNQKIKEIKNLSGDFKNSVQKEIDVTKKAVNGLQEALGLVDTDPHAASGKGDPFIIKLGVERQIEKQIDEENYLHRAFLNLENSGRELESIVVGEIQKAHNAFASILKREADEAYQTIEKLRSGPIAMDKAHEWESFVEKNESFIDPRIPLRKVEDIEYPGKDNPAALEVRAGMLERKSKYLKSYTPGWYVLSPTHLHEFKSPERVNAQLPVMSLYLLEQKLGSHSQRDSSSHKFMLKGRQTGTMHRGHSWVFRAESYDTMMAWFDDMKSLTEKSGTERDAFVRKHARSVSSNSQRAGSISSDAMDEDEADAVPYSATESAASGHGPTIDETPKRPSPGGRFPSDIQVDRGLQAPLSPSSASSGPDYDLVVAAGAASGFAPELYGGYGNSNAHGGAVPEGTLDAGRNIDTSSTPLDQSGPSQGYFHHDSSANSYFNWDSHHGNTGQSVAPAVTGGVIGAVAAKEQAGDGHQHSNEGDASLPKGLPEAAAPLASPTNDFTYTEGNNYSTQDHETNSIPLAGGSIPNNTMQREAVSTDGISAASTTNFQAVDGLGILKSQPSISTLGPDTPALGTQSSSKGGHNASASISELHVPGEYPPTPSPF
ncbi:MAG: hypothetical protein M1829_006594 [Trizodia sp. TS-e1964]|nr:MAG: hypothetical protein M1829_006594 [Trizodia sp. TS-e1964]